MPQIKSKTTTTETPAPEANGVAMPASASEGVAMPPTVEVVATPVGATEDAVQSVGATEAKPAKKAKPAKSAKATATTAATEASVKTPRTRNTGDSGKTTGERRLMVIKALRKAKAVAATSGMTADQLAAKTGLTRFDVYGQLYHTHHLQTSGLVEQVNVEGVRGLSYHLTAKGAKASDAEVTGAKE